MNTRQKQNGKALIIGNYKLLIILGELLFYLRNIRLSKLLNATKLYGAYAVSRVWGKPIMWGMPVSLSVEPYAGCNLKCPECPTGKGFLPLRNTRMQPNQLQKLLDELHPYLFYLQLFFQGEPFINKQLPELILLAHGYGVYTSVSTNGHYITEQNANAIVRAGLNQLIVSIDGATPETYVKYRVGGNFTKVKRAVQLIAEAKKRLNSTFPVLVVQFVVFRFNQHEIADIKVLAKQLGADKVRIKSAQIYNFEHNPQQIPTIDKFARYKQDFNGKWQIKSKLPNHCKRMWTNPVVTATNQVLPCCFAKDSMFTMANTQTNNFAQIWKNEDYTNFRKAIFSNRKGFEMCRNCTESL